MKQAAMRTLRRNGAVGALTGFSIILVVLLAYWSSSSKPPSAAQAALLTVLSAAAQILASMIATTRGRADPNFVKSAVARLASIGLKIQKCEEVVQEAFEQGSAQERRVVLGKISVTMSFLQEETKSAIQDWKNLHPDAVEALIEVSAIVPNAATAPTTATEAANV